VEGRRLIIPTLVLTHALTGNNKNLINTEKTLIISRTRRNTE